MKRLSLLLFLALVACSRTPPPVAVVDDTATPVPVVTFELVARQNPDTPTPAPTVAAPVPTLTPAAPVAPAAANHFLLAPGLAVEYDLDAWEEAVDIMNRPTLFNRENPSCFLRSARSEDDAPEVAVREQLLGGAAYRIVRINNTVKGVYEFWISGLSLDGQPVDFLAYGEASPDIRKQCQDALYETLGHLLFVAR